MAHVSPSVIVVVLGVSTGRLHWISLHKYLSLSFFLSLLVRSYMSITPGSANLEILIK